LVPLAGGIVMPGVHDAAPGLLLQLAPMFPPDGAQFEPLQQMGACGGCDVHVNPGAQPPIESQRQPCSPTRHVEGPPPELEPELLPLPDPLENPPELEALPLPDPEAPEDAPELAPLPDPEAPEDDPELVPPLLPHAATTTRTGIAKASEARGERRGKAIFPCYQRDLGALGAREWTV
jgi:hypothetical protein